MVWGTAAAAALLAGSWTVQEGSEARSQATVEVTQWRGLDALRLSNRWLEVVVVPEIGRVMSLRVPGRPNVLFAPQEPKHVGGWKNWGGDKLWHAPQAQWGWPPDPALDGSRHQVTFIPGGIKLSSPVSPKSGLQLSRLIRLDPESPRVHFLNVVTNWSRSAKRAAAWQVTQVGQPREVGMGLGSPANGETRLYTYGPNFPDPSLYKVGPDTVTAVLHPGKAFKLGAGGRSAWAEFGNGDVLFLFNGEPRRTAPGYMAGEPGIWSEEELAMGTISESRGSDSRDFADSGSAMQIYLGEKEAGYAELEANGRLQLLPPGEAAAFPSQLVLFAGAK